MSNKYTCSLTEKSIKKAKKELNEDPKERDGAVKTFREWIQTQKHVTCDTDSLFLLRFLRCAKFSQLRARTLLENYLRSLDKYADWCRDLDTHDPKLIEYFKTGHSLYNGTNDKGETVVIITPNRIDTASKVYGSADMMRGVIAHILNQFHDEEIQVNGMMFLLDTTAFGMKHQVYFPPEGYKKGFNIFQNAFPSRVKGIHYYNMGSVMTSLLALIKPFMSKKWIERLRTHSTLESLYKYTQKSALPQEYLPDDHKGPHTETIQQVTDKLFADLMKPETREKILRMTSREHFRIDMKAKEDEPQASFRKLNID